MKRNAKPKTPTYFVAFYKGYTHHWFYRVTTESVREIRKALKAEFGKITDIVIDKVA